MAKKGQTGQRIGRKRKKSGKFGSTIGKKKR
jgi:hypothetical protein